MEVEVEALSPAPLGEYVASYINATRQLYRLQPPRLVRTPTMSVSTASSATDVDAGLESETPRIEALFLIRFDKKVGYGMRPRGTAWSQEPMR